MVEVPEIVTVELWEAAQAQLEANRQKFCKPTRHPYMLRGRVSCGACGGKLVGTSYTSNGRVHRHYRCTHAASKYLANRCTAEWLNAECAETAVWRELCEVMLDPDRLFVGVEERRAEAGRRIIQNAIAALHAQNEKTQQKLDRFLELYSEGGLSKAAYRKKEIECSAEIEKRLQERTKHEAKLAAYTVLSPDQETELREFQRAVAERMRPDAPYEGKVRLLELLSVECVFNAETKELVVSGLMGSWTLTVGSGSAARLRDHCRQPAPEHGWLAAARKCAPGGP
jgi:hypothetical protein